VAEINDPMVPRDDPEPGGDGLRWSFELNLESVLAQIGRRLGGLAGEDQEAILAAENEARDSQAPSVDLAGLVAEHLPAGPGLAAWLAQQDPGQLADRDLPGAAAAFRKVASWAQAAELKAVAQITARSAARDKNAGLEADGRPAQVTRDAAAQVGLGLALSPCGAAAWAGLAVTLNWRLPVTGAALADGTLDLYRARIIAEATAPLSDADARKVEDQLVPGAGDMTYGQLHAALRRAVLAADPEGAEHRRQAAERRARVSLYPDQDQTATLTGSTLPAIHAAAAMARISAMARALKASGAAGGTDYLRAHVFMGLLMGTLPLIPPPAGAPPDDDPPCDEDPPPGALPRTEDPPREDPPRGDRSCGAPPGSGTSRHGPVPHPRGASPSDASPPRGSPPGSPPDGSSPLGSSLDGGPPDGSWSEGTAGEPADVWDTEPPLTDADAPEDDGFRDSPPPLPDGYDDDVRYWGDPLDDHFADRGTVPALPPVPATVPAAAGDARFAEGSGRPPPGLLDVSVPWATLICQSPVPGTIGRIGPVTATQARQLARLALTSYTTR
jgi:hypothetical protein